MSEPIRDIDAVNRHRADEANAIGDEAETTASVAARPCTVPVRPGYGQAAYKAGCEDEYDNEMEARYGEGM